MAFVFFFCYMDSNRKDYISNSPEFRLIKINELCNCQEGQKEQNSQLIDVFLSTEKGVGKGRGENEKMRNEKMRNEKMRNEK